ncbi:hypothetical protein FHG89_24920 [Micromonospora orduensis]|uniref:GerMN domain-containing protein n=1 Tax=Micromonospora orduensis TaxID=1420891 RepID=A0A5C4QEC4_9ACTN|nr:hypothetical protein [Micromonospora orduensis]TNH24460.1 hypothetical protein FHG89_24920 [Micromonospora orduensis]
MSVRRVLVRPLLTGGLLLTLLVAGCGVRPSEVITGRPAQSGASQGIRLYLLWRGQVAVVVRPTKVNPSPSPEASLALLLAGPEEYERRQGFTSEVPAGLRAVPSVPPAGTAPGSPPAVSGGAGGLTVTVTGPVRPLSTDAADQIICTVADAAAQAGQAEYFVPVTIVGSDGARPALPCSIR